MLTGKPRLTTWSASDQTMRLFEMDNTNTFVQIMAIGAASAVTPVLFFHPIGDFAGIFRKANANDAAGFIGTYDYSGALISSLARPSGMSTATKLWMILGAATRPWLAAMEVIASGLSPQSNSDASMDAGGNLISLTGNAFSTGSIGRASPDGNLIFAANTGNTAGTFWKVSNYQANGNPTLVTPGKTFSTNSRTIADARWTQDSRYMVVAYTNGDVDVVSVAATDATPSVVNTIHFSQVPQSLAMHPVGKYAALGVNDGGTYKTFILKFEGPIISDTGNHYTGPGQNVKFTADGRFLLDAMQKKGLHYLGSGAFEAYDSALANMPASVAAFAVSFDVDVPQPTAHVYNAALAAILAGTVDTSNLKIMLLDSTATFAATDNLAAVQAHEVHGGAWPVGGVAINNVTLANGGSVFTWAADAIHYLNVGGDVAFYKVVIYDDTNDTPLAYYDYGLVQTLDDSSYANFDLTTGFLKLVA
jgi:hypothetical protein